MSCIKQGHFVGGIRNEPIRAPDWEKAVSAFEALVDDFNIRGQRDEIAHPGWCTVFNFCPDCGTKLDKSATRTPQWKTEAEVKGLTAGFKATRRP